MTGFSETSASTFAEVVAGTRFDSMRWVAATGSTNDDLAAAVQRGEPDQVLVADLQTRGRGRRDRQWVAPAESSILMSFLIRGWPQQQAFWAIGAVSLGVAEAVSAHMTTPCRLKWPNDLLVGEAKLAGILAQWHDDALIAGIGVNVNWPLQKPTGVPAHATAVNHHLSVPPGERSLDRRSLVAEIVPSVDRLLALDPATLRTRWLGACATIGRRVRAQLSDHAATEGIAVDVEPSGALVIASDDGARHAVHVGDVVHLRGV